MSNLSLKLKMFNGMYKFVTSKQDSLPLYHGNDIPEFVAADAGSDLPRGTAEQVNISRSAIIRFINRLSCDDHINLAGIGIMVDGKLVTEHYEAPFNNTYRHVSFSMCKSVVSMAIGIAVSEGLLSLDEKIYDIFPAHNGIFVKKYMKEITIRHLLTMTSGASFDEVSSCFSPDWCKSYIGSDVKFEPGTSFTYNSLNTYMLAAVLKKKSGMGLVEYLTERLFEPLDIHDVTWDKCPTGIEKGGWGMKLSLVDMLKLGQLYLDKGVWKSNGTEKRILSREWIDESVTCHSQISGKKFVRGYGYQIWLLRDGAYLFNGVFGQNVYINTKRNMVIATTASAYEMFPEGRLIEAICRFAARDENFVSDDGIKLVRAKFREKLGVGKKISTPNLKTRMYEQREYRKLKEFLNPHFDVTYKFSEYASSILPVSSQVVYSNFMSGIEQLTLHFKNNQLLLCVSDSGSNYQLDIGYTATMPYVYQIIEINGKKLPVAVAGRVVCDEDDRILFKINIVYLEEVGSKIFKLYFEQDGLKLKAYETPDMMIVADKMFGEKLIRRTKNLDKNSTPEYMKYKIHQVLSPKVRGHIDE